MMDASHYPGWMIINILQKQPKDDSEANGSEPSTLSSPVSGGGHHGEPASRETTDTEAAGQRHARRKSDAGRCQALSLNVKRAPNRPLPAADVLKPPAFVRQEMTWSTNRTRCCSSRRSSSSWETSSHRNQVRGTDHRVRGGVGPLRTQTPRNSITRKQMRAGWEESKYVPLWVDSLEEMWGVGGGRED